MPIAESLSTIDALVKALPEVYQPIFGHPEFSPHASRQSEDRLAYIVAIHDALAERLGRRVRVLDLGCAQGFFTLNLAARGAIVHGVDFADANIAVCRALAGEHPHFDAVFEFGRIEDVIPRLPAGSIDLVLGLSVFHHIVFQSGIASTRQLIAWIAERAGVGVFEMALPSEPLYWAAAQPGDPRVLLSGYGHVYEMARHGTHLSTVARPLYIASRDARPEFAAIAGEASVSPISDAGPIPSAQCRDDGTPRFHVRPFNDGTDWDAVAAREGAGGIEAETRLFLAMQLEPGDLVVDLAPGAGFVALAAATEPARPHVLCLVDSEAQRAALARAADDADAHIETVIQDASGGSVLMRLVRERAIQPHRIVVHADADAVVQWGARFAALSDGGEVLAWCVGGARDAGRRAAARTVLHTSHFTARQLAESNEGVVLVEAPADADEYIAIHRSVLDEPSDDIFPAATSDVSHQASGVSVRTETSGDEVRPQAVSRWPGFHFIAPFCRTGYGVSGACILMSLVRLGAPVSFFPLGTLDRTMFAFDGLDGALDRQDDFDPMLPSVRLSQQFDLAMHVGRGPRIGFPIFELNRFSARARHHLAAQDRLLVCSEWARGILLENGLWRSPIHVVPLGVDRMMFNERIGSRAGARGDRIPPGRQARAAQGTARAAGRVRSRLRTVRQGPAGARLSQSVPERGRVRRGDRSLPRIAHGVAHHAPRHAAAHASRCRATDGKRRLRRLRIACRGLESRGA